jgi:hypothetical protein
VGHGRARDRPAAQRSRALAVSRVGITSRSSKQMQPPPNTLPRVQSNRRQRPCRCELRRDGPHGDAQAEAVHHGGDGRLLLYFAHAQHRGGRAATSLCIVSAWPSTTAKATLAKGMTSAWPPTSRARWPQRRSRSTSPPTPTTTPPSTTCWRGMTRSADLPLLVSWVCPVGSGECG